MRTLPFQDLVTIFGASTVTSVTQEDAFYVDLEAFQDFTVWVEVSAVDVPSSFATLWLETAPLKEEALFVTPLVSAQTSVILAPGVATLRNVLNAPMLDTAGKRQIPAARWLRWRITQGAASAAWSVTFRLSLAAHSVCLPPSE